MHWIKFKLTLLLCPDHSTMAWLWAESPDNAKVDVIRCGSFCLGLFPVPSAPPVRLNSNRELAVLSDENRLRLSLLFTLVSSGDHVGLTFPSFFSAGLARSSWEMCALSGFSLQDTEGEFMCASRESWTPSIPHFQFLSALPSSTLPKSRLTKAVAFTCASFRCIGAKHEVQVISARAGSGTRAQRKNRVQYVQLDSNPKTSFILIILTLIFTFYTLPSKFPQNPNIYT